jgi:hypothetical protein
MVGRNTAYKPPSSPIGYRSPVGHTSAGMVIPVPRAGFIEKFLGARGWNQKGGAAVSLVSALTTVWCLTMARSTVPQLSRPRAEPQRSGEALGASVMLWLIVIGLAVVAFYAL